MNRSRIIAVGIALAASIPLPLATPVHAATPYAERSDQTVDAAALRSLDLENPRGLVRVRPSADGKLHVTAIKICRMQRPEDARRYARETTVEAYAEAGRWVMRVKYPKRIETKIDLWELFSTRGRNDISFPMIEVQLLLEAPAGLTARVETVSGDIDVQGMKGALTLHSTSGDLLVHDALAALDASSVSGDIEMQGVSRATVHSTSGDVSIEDAGALAVSTVSGSIDVQAARDTVHLTSTSGDVQVQGAIRGATVTTTSGDISIEQCSGVVRLNSMSGDIEAGIAGPLRRCDIGSTSGEIAASVASGVDASLELRTTNGTMECAIPVRLLSHDRRRLTAVLGKGGAPITLQTVSGDINLTSGGTRP